MAKRRSYVDDSIQVYEGCDHGPRYLLLREVEEITSALVELMVDLNTSRKYLDNPSIVTVRLIFADKVVAYLREEVPFSMAAMGVRDLNDLAGHLEIRNRQSTADRIRTIVGRIEYVREARNAA